MLTSQTTKQAQRTEGSCTGSADQSGLLLLACLNWPAYSYTPYRKQLNPLASEKIRTDSRSREIHVQTLTPFNYKAHTLTYTWPKLYQIHSTIKNKSICRHKIPKICPVYRLEPKNWIPWKVNFILKPLQWLTEVKGLILFTLLHPYEPREYS